MIFGAKTYKIKPLIDFSNNKEKNSEIISVSIDNHGLNILTIQSTPNYRTPDGMFAVIKSTEPKDYIFLRYDLNGNEVLKATIKNEYFNFHNVNYLPSNEILLICSRSRYKSQTEVDKNARVFDLNGKFIRDFVVGDGIQDVKIDNSGYIWTSYFDEGIFGNYGWDFPIGSSGLVCWNNQGKKIWEFESTEELDQMFDCYAMNIDSENNTWFYYYSEFSLVKLNNSKQLKHWKPKLDGSSSINILNNRILMSGGYNDDNFIIFDIDGSKLKKSKRIKFQSIEGLELNKRNYISSLGSNIGFLDNNKLYYINMHEIN